MATQVVVDYAGTIEVARGDNPIQLYEPHKEAVPQLNGQLITLNRQPFAGLLVIPTGGGKTLTAVQWLLRNCVDKGKKVLWIAHRHELLEQAKEAFQNNAYSNVLKSRRSFNYRIISGIHDKPKDIRRSDDIIIASKDSLRSETATQYLFDWLRASDGELFLVVDEAHHAIAKTYRKLIGWLKDQVSLFRMLGLTATPFRTTQNEQGLLGKLFTDDIVYKVDLRPYF
jgi:ATP-dependent helicase IRC3